MEKITLNGKLYIALGDFYHLRRNLVKDIYDKYERDENGQYHISDIDMGQIDAYAHIMTKILETEIHAAESPDEIRAIHDRLRKEWMHDKFVIVANDNGENVFYRKYCGVNENGEDQPVFTSKIRLAHAWSDHYAATLTAQYIEQHFDIECKVEPLYLFAMTNEDAKKLLDAIFDKKYDEPEYHGDGVKAEDEYWDGEEE